MLMKVMYELSINLKVGKWLLIVILYVNYWSTWNVEVFIGHIYCSVETKSLFPTTLHMTKYDTMWIRMIYYDYGGVIMIEGITILNEKLWTWVKGYSYSNDSKVERTISPSECMSYHVPWWYDFYEFFHEHEHK